MPVDDCPWWLHTKVSIILFFQPRTLPVGDIFKGVNRIDPFDDYRNSKILRQCYCRRWLWPFFCTPATDDPFTKGTKKSVVNCVIPLLLESSIPRPLTQSIFTGRSTWHLNPNQKAFGRQVLTLVGDNVRKLMLSSDETENFDRRYSQTLPWCKAVIYCNFFVTVTVKNSCVTPKVSWIYIFQ